MEMDSAMVIRMIQQGKEGEWLSEEAEAGFPSALHTFRAYLAVRGRPRDEQRRAELVAAYKEWTADRHARRMDHIQVLALELAAE
jgi:hypothetical protein